MRADTIDLQDPGSPSAADHTRQPTQPAPLGIGPAAPHQQAALRQVEEERSTEEDTLAHWNGEEQNGADPDMTDDGDMADSETEDMDDDMDKISSSPSIDDGRCSLPSSAAYASAWPTRSSSLSAIPLPATPPQQHFNVQQHYNVSSEPDEGSSSPFTVTPQHLPLSYQLLHHPETPPIFSTPLSSSPPSRLPQKRFSFADHHHRRGEYRRTGPADQDVFGTDFENGLEYCHGENWDYVNEPQDMGGPLFSEQYEKELYENEFGGDEEDDALVFPSNRPLPPIPVSDSTNDLREALLRKASGSPTNSLSWETDSNASSWDPQDDDDDSKDISFSLDPDRTDSAYGGECLRETEDIDFEFVYALHTFVATVEGQANATKGDTMVLLDDSNSYWWLVRVVKDSSIGRDLRMDMGGPS